MYRKIKGRDPPSIEILNAHEILVPSAALPILPSSYLGPFCPIDYRLGISMFDARSPTNRRLNGGKTGRFVAATSVHRNYRISRDRSINRYRAIIAELIGWIGIRYVDCCANWRVAHYRDIVMRHLIIIVIIIINFILPSLDNFNQN